MKKISIIAALSVSLFIYVTYRSEKTLVNEFIIFLFSYDTYLTLKMKIMHAIPVHDAIIFSLPGGLWIFCATGLSQEFYLKIRNLKIQLALIPILFALGLECCQVLHFTNGRFDVWDILAYLVFWLAAYYLFPPRANQKDIASPFTLRGFICLACLLSVYLAHVNQ